MKLPILLGQRKERSRGERIGFLYMCIGLVCEALNLKGLNVVLTGRMFNPVRVLGIVHSIYFTSNSAIVTKSYSYRYAHTRSTLASYRISVSGPEKTCAAPAGESKRAPMTNTSVSDVWDQDQPVSWLGP